MFYAPDILNTFFTEDAAIRGTFILMLINFSATFITVFSVDKFGRVKLLVCGGIIMFAALITNAVLSSLNQTITVGWCVIAVSAIFVIGFAFSWGPVVWIVCAEMFPYHTRGKSTGLTTMTNWLCTTIVGAVFPAASSASLSGCFAFFAVAIFIGNWVVYLYQVETASLNSPQIKAAYKAHKPALKRKNW
jgi:MFS family permease